MIRNIHKCGGKWENVWENVAALQQDCWSVDFHYK